MVNLCKPSKMKVQSPVKEHLYHIYLHVLDLIHMKCYQSEKKDGKCLFLI